MPKQILKAHIPFVGGSGSKPRPVVQLTQPADEHGNFQVIYITSQMPPQSYPTDLLIPQNHPDFIFTGLATNSYIRCSKIFTIDPSLVESVIGDLPDDLGSKLDTILKNYFNI